MFFRLFKARSVLIQITWLLCDTECQFPISQSSKKEWVVESSNSWQIMSTVMSVGTSVRYVNDQTAEWSNFLSFQSDVISQTIFPRSIYLSWYAKTLARESTWFSILRLLLLLAVIPIWFHVTTLTWWWMIPQCKISIFLFTMVFSYRWGFSPSFSGWARLDIDFSLNC